MSRQERSFTNAGWLLLSDLLIGIAPRANLQPPADPAQTFRGIGRAGGPADGAFLDPLQLIRLNGALRLFQ